MENTSNLLKQISKGKIRIHNHDQNELKIIFTGDFCPINRIESGCLRENYNTIYNDLLPILFDKDISITNLECPLTINRRPIKKSGPNLMANPKCIEAIKYGKFDVLTLANNHIMDQGKDGLKDTIEICEKHNIKTVGAGRNSDEASKILYLESKRGKIAVLNFAEHEFSIAKKNKSGAPHLDIIRNYYQILEAKENADYVFIIVHGGNEHYHLPSPRYKKIFHFFADLGITAVIGHHTHCSSGIEIYKGIPLIYSLGNFIFDWPGESFKPWFEGFLVNITISKSGVSEINIIPYNQCKEKPQISLMKDKEKDIFLNKIAEYSKIISKDILLEKEWDKFCEERKNNYLSSLLGLNRIERYLLKKRKFIKLVINNERLLSLLSMLRCEAHNELAIKILEEEILKEI